MQGFFARRFGVGDMHLIQIDIVGLQTRQAFLNGLHDPAAEAPWRALSSLKTG
jgi:hypothetical protein